MKHFRLANVRYARLRKEMTELKKEMEEFRSALQELYNVQRFSKGWDNGVTDSTGTINEGDCIHGDIMDAVHALLERKSQ